MRAFPQSGFTLLEMLVVVMLMGLIIGLISVTARPDERGILRLEAERLARLLALAQDEAQLTGKGIRWSAGEDGYRFLRMRKDGGWREIHDNDTLRARKLPAGMKITGLRVDMHPRSVVILEFVPYGAAQAFRIDMSYGEHHTAITSSPIGDIGLLQEAPEANATH